MELDQLTSVLTDFLIRQQEVSWPTFLGHRPKDALTL